MTLHDLLTSPDIDNLRLAVAMRDMWTAKEWAAAIWEIHQKLLTAEETGLWELLGRTVTSILVDTILGEFTYKLLLNGIAVVEVCQDKDKVTRFYALDMGEHTDEKLSIIDAIEKAISHGTT